MPRKDGQGDRLTIRLLKKYRDFVEMYRTTPEFRALPFSRKLFAVLDDIINEKTIGGIVNRHLDEIFNCKTMRLTVERVHQIRVGARPTMQELLEIHLALHYYEVDHLVELRSKQYGEAGDGGVADSHLPDGRSTEQDGQNPGISSANGSDGEGSDNQG